MEAVQVPEAHGRRRVELVASAVADLGAAALLVSRPSNVRYLTGFTGSAGYLLVSREGQTRLVVDVRYAEQAREQARSIEVDGSSAPPLLWRQAVDLASAFAPGSWAIEAGHLTAANYIDLQRSDLQLIPSRDLVERIRMVKDADELELLRQAGSVADRVLEHLRGWIRPGISELEVAGEVEKVQRQLGASASATDVIVASGPRSALPHGRATDRVIGRGEPVMVDMSPTVQGYRADVTRVFHTGPASDRFVEIYSLVAAAEAHAESHVRPGLSTKDADQLARKLITDAGYGEYFQHSLGHGVGLDIHEPPLLSPHDSGLLQAGMVVTIEPGIYVPGLGGARVENSVVLSAKGAESLNRFSTDLITVSDE